MAVTVNLALVYILEKNALLKVVNKVNFDTLWRTGALAANDGWYVGLRMQWFSFTFN